MTTRRVQDHWRPLDALWSAGVLGTRTDGELLDCFRTDRGAAGQEAFRILVERHGPMVLGLCRSLVKDAHEAEDAFQATFLVLVRRADSIRRRDTIGPWLHGVAARIARRAYSRSIRRQKRELPCLVDVPVRNSFAPERPAIEPIVQDEIARLAESFRAPVVLCCLQGLSYNLAARQLGLSEPTLRGRLHRARKHLAARLRARGIASSLVGSTIEPLRVALPALPSSLIESTVQCSMRYWALSGLLARAPAIPGSISALSEGAIKSMIFQAYKLPAIVALTTAALLGTVVLAQQGKNTAAGGSKSPVQNPGVAAQDRPPETAPREPARDMLDADQKRQSIIAQLSLIIDAEFPNGVELEHFLKYIKQLTSEAKPPGLPIYVDPVGLEDAEKTMSSKVIVNLRHRPVRAVLRSALKTAELAYRVKDGFIYIESDAQSLEARLDEIENTLDRILEGLGRLERAK